MKVLINRSSLAHATLHLFPYITITNLTYPLVAAPLLGTGWGFGAGGWLGIGLGEGSGEINDGDCSNSLFFPMMALSS